MRPGQLYIIPLLIAISACGQSSKTVSFTEKTFVVARKETVEIKEIGFKITNNGCGRKWISPTGDKPSYERPFCELEIDYKGERSRAGNNFDTVSIRDLKLVVQSMNPWGRMEDSVPAGGCRVWVKLIR